VGQRIARLEIRDAKLWHPAEGLSEDAVAGRIVTALDRRAKLFLFTIEGGLALALHLKIAGQICLQEAGGSRFVGGHPYPLPCADLPDSSTRFVLYMGNGDTLFVNDQRRFSWLRLMPVAEVEAFVAGHKFGPDPLDAGFTPQVLAQRLKARKGRPVKAALLDQTCVSGLGNIYADEALHRARLHPMARAGDLSGQEVARLHRAITDVLAVAVPVAGALVKIGRAVDEPESGKDFLRAHGRAGEPCPNCAEDADEGRARRKKRPSDEEPRIVRAFLAGRGTYFCPTCQPAPPGFVMPPPESR
jgi:formamidopyrimidine-DNA glycosylase